MENHESDIHYHGPVVVFDLDDTLFSEREHAVSAYREVAGMPDLTTPALSERVVNVMTAALDNGSNPFDALDALLEGDRIGTFFTTAQRVEVYRRHRPHRLTLYPDALELLDSLRQRGIRCAIVTDGRSLTQRAKLKALGIADRFHPADIIISEESGHDKSEPDNFAAIVHHYPEASRFIYIGDNPAKDFDIPAMLGWDTVCLLTRGANIHPQTPSPELKTVASLCELINQINQF